MLNVVGRRPFSHGSPGEGPHPLKIKTFADRSPRYETSRIQQPPSCIEFYPVDRRYFVIGTYKLLDGKAEDRSDKEDHPSKKRQERKGSLIACRLDQSHTRIEYQKVVKLSHAVFDLHFHPKYHDLLGIATSSTKISFFKFRSAPLSLQYLFSVPVHEDPTAFATYFAWSPIPHKSPVIGLTVTFSDGTVHRVEDIALRPPPKTSRKPEIHALQPHSLEAWYAAYFTSLVGQGEDFSVARRILTGGDDGALILHDIPTKPGTAGHREPQSAIFTDTRIHSAGVTAILPLPSLRVYLGRHGDFILTGSYDEHIRLIHMSSIPPFPRNVVASLNLGGGVWRIKMLSDVYIDGPDRAEGPFKLAFLVLASCMHAGPKILRFVCVFERPSEKSVGQGGGKDESQEVPQTWNIEPIVTNFNEHESMNYGSAWTLATNEKGEGSYYAGNAENVVVVSTSFYDEKVCIWRAFIA